MGKLINNLITPFNEEGKVCFKTLKLLLDEASRNKNDALVLFSLCGEGTSLSILEKIEIILRNKASWTDEQQIKTYVESLVGCRVDIKKY